jgi:glycosyltransferase involved in cell wall biosynthesis
MAQKPHTFLHLEASNGWGGQEIRTLKEAASMREKGHTVLFAVQHGAQLGDRAKKEGFEVRYLDFRRRKLFITVPKLIFLIEKRGVDRVITHSSKDGWLGGLAARLARCQVIRTRHLSTAVKKGLNSYLLYNFLADKVVTTCEAVALSLQQQARLPKERCCSIPTGVDPIAIEQGLTSTFPKPSPFVIGTACILRSWKGLPTLVEAFALLRDDPDISLLILGHGSMRPHLEKQAKSLDLAHRIHFTGHLENPYPAMASMDLFLLLSTAHEGVSQATLQAAYLSKPMITTPTGGLPEVALHNKTGFVVPCNSPEQVAKAILKLKDEKLREQFGQASKKHLMENFLWSNTVARLCEFYEV